MRSSTDIPVVLPAEAVQALTEQPIGAIGGVGNRVLWRTEHSMAGVLRIEAGHHLGAHTHAVNSHHLWVLTGRVRMLGQELGAGSYVHIPSGVEHDLDARATEGCTTYYLYLGPS